METEKTFQFSDIYNAQLFRDLNKDTVRWCRDYGGWFIYNGKIWKKDNNDAIKGLAIKTHAKLHDIMVSIKSDIAFNHSKRSGSNAALNSMMDCSKPYLGCSSDDFDSSPFLFNCENGTINIETKEFMPFRSSDMLTKTGYVSYNGDAVAPLWDNFLQEIFLGDNELISYIQRVIGYSMTSLNTEQCMFIFYGQGRNGKSKFIESIFNIMGDYALNCPSSTFAVKNNPGISNDVARLKGSRMVTAIESNANVYLDESIVKQMTGGDKITARFLNKEFFEFMPTFKIFFATNHKPRIRGTDTGIWRRIQMIPFNLNITEEQEDKNLGYKLREESSGILNWMLEGYQMYKRDGLKIPQAIRNATKIYKEEEDDIGQFIKDECVLEKGCVIAANEFLNKFNEVMGYRKGNRSVADYMTRHGFKPMEDSRVVIKGKRQRAYFGLRWANELDSMENKGWQE